ncbi:MAG: hypothetical protein KAS32_15475 [Candidatus Peribacteraceae bacterium]|nr:hypothetical protein [Candidatus Peribacteraceae bacterium]
MSNDNLNELLEKEEAKQAIVSDVGNHELSSNDHPYTLSLRREDIDDEKEMKKFVKACETLIRRSPEYKIWTEYVREILGYVTCALTKEQHVQTTCDIHHHPISLYTITKAVITQKIANSTNFCSADIVTEVLEIHYDLRVGFVSILSSLHEKFHRGYLQLPIELVHGDYMNFVHRFGPYLGEDELEVINSRTAIKLENCGYGDEYFWSSDGYMESEKTQAKEPTE